MGEAGVHPQSVCACLGTVGMRLGAHASCHRGHTDPYAACRKIKIRCYWMNRASDLQETCSMPILSETCLF